MAFELLARCPINEFQTPSEESGSVTEERLDEFLSFRGQPLAPNTAKIQIPSPAKHPKSIIYTFQYDLESVLWIILWTLLARVVHPPGQKYVPELYVNKLKNAPERYYIVFVRDHLLSVLQDKLHHGLSDLAPIIANFGNRFWSAYVKREQNDQVREHTSYAEIYTEMMVFFLDCIHFSTRQDYPN